MHESSDSSAGDASEGSSLTIGTRSSRLARWQAEYVSDRLQESGRTSELREITTTGDLVRDVALSRIGQKAVFTKELDAALLDGAIDCAVHSLKDLPTRLPDGLLIAAVSPRRTPWDVLSAGPSFSGAIRDLPEGAVLGTSSLRRTAQLLAWRPDLRVESIRGNVDTRLEKLAERDWEGLVLAEAGLRRIERADAVTERFPPDIMLPAVGQGALGVVCREDAEALRAVLVEAIEDPSARFATTAERAMLRRLEGGCQIPVGAWGRMEDDGTLHLDGCVASLDGSDLVRGGLTGRPEDAASIGVHLAEYLLGRGGAEILETVREQVDL